MSAAGEQAVPGGSLALGARKRPASYSDVILAFGAVVIVSLMILPLPTLLIDILVAVNIAIGVGLLLIAIYIPNPVAFSAFPSVLLLTTLLRLSLSIAVTRLILLDADAGHIVETFGTLVAGGNLVVGLVVFLIITVVQFIVIAKGAERVAEVAARFSLDAMPGKQLSIDSDLRSGLMDKDEAKRKRRHLEIESQLHGSLDGAMKFVKGDAIAGIVIIIVNIIGGLSIGVLQNDMALGDAVQTYSILTIGDGLVSQIPALLAAIAAGLIVTRTASDEQDRHLGEAISRQISGEPRVLMITGGIALLMMLVPGFPSLVFLAIGSVLIGIALWRMGLSQRPLRRMLRRPEPATAVVDGGDAEVAAPPPLKLSLAPDLVQAFGETSVTAGLTLRVRELRETYGVPVPSLVLASDSRLPEHSYRLDNFGVRMASGRLDPARRFRRQPNETPGDSGFFPPLAGQWLSAGSAGFDSALDAQSLLLHHLGSALERRLGSFIGIQETSNLFTRMSRDYPDLVKEMLRAVAPQRLADVLRRLVEERVSIRNLRDLFETITEVGAREKDVVMLTEHVRAGMKREISDAHADAGRTLRVLVVHPELEDRLRQSVRTVAGASQLAIAPELASRVLGEIRSALARHQEGQAPVLLCSMDVRRHLRRLIEIDFFELSVLSYQELVPDLQIAQLGQINA